MYFAVKMHHRVLHMSLTGNIAMAARTGKILSKTHRFPSVLLDDALNASGNPEIATAGVGDVKGTTQGIHHFLHWLFDVQLQRKGTMYERRV